MIQSSALPARFRRSRIALVGFGDVAARIVSQQKAVWKQAPQSARILGIGRRTGWDLDDHRQCQRLAACARHWIILVPPSDQPSQGTTDRRSKMLTLSLRAQRYRANALPLRSVYISTTGVYGDHGGARVSETSATMTRQPRSLRRLHAERLWRSLGGHVLRVPGITAEDRLPLERIRNASPALRPEDDVFTNHIHANDLARLCWAALWRGRPARITNTVMPVHLKMGDYFDCIADAFGLPRGPRISREEMALAVREGRVSPMMASFMQDSRQVSGRRISELRVKLHYERVEQFIHRSAHSAPR
ncbi:MAG: hypothetical protein RLZZ290_477 [Pseudomonadota bacterium]|jgi:dTDP-4-dehydrorhamnose reductase